MGNKLPMFYIGSTSLFKIEKGYKGSVSSKQYKSLWKTELKNNPELFKTKVISIHTDRKSATEKENMLHRKLSVVKNVLYVNKAMAIPSGCFGDNQKGKYNPMFGLKRPDSKFRMLNYNPMKNKDISTKVALAKEQSRITGKHKSTKNKKSTIVKTKRRMTMNNPSRIKCSCITCKRETVLSAIVRFHNHER
jgi:hypothetical protein